MSASHGRTCINGQAEFEDKEEYFVWYHQCGVRANKVKSLAPIATNRNPGLLEPIHPTHQVTHFGVWHIPQQPTNIALVPELLLPHSIFLYRHSWSFCDTNLGLTLSLHTNSFRILLIPPCSL